MEVYSTVISFYKKKSLFCQVGTSVIQRNAPSPSPNLQKKAVSSTESMVPTYQTTRWHNPEDHNIFTAVKTSAPLSSLQYIRLIYSSCNNEGIIQVALNILWSRVQHTMRLSSEWHFLYSQHEPIMSAWGWLASASQWLHSFLSGRTQWW
jgi:hypothetical protein